MKRKIACLFMALMLVVSLLPMGAVRAGAASSWNYSENVVNLIKQFEGFSATAYWDISQWTVGYGTPAVAGQTMTEAQADLALRDRLNTINAAINQLAASRNLYLTQYQHDALVSFSFNCGTEWMGQGGRFFNAVVSNSGVDQFLFAISLWANAGTSPDANLLNRRMSEANLYLNGVYSKSAPSSYTYVILDANGGTPGSNGEDKMQGYQIGANVPILAAAPTKSGYTFAGWFTSPTGGTQVTYLNASTAGRTLYAQYTTGSGTSTGTTGRGDLIPAAYGSVTGSSVNVRSGAGTNYPVVGTAYSGQTISIYEATNVNGTAWARIGDNRWISMAYVKVTQTVASDGIPTTGTTTGSTIIWDNGNSGTSTTPSSTNYTLGTVTASGLNVRTGPGVNYPICGAVMRNATVKVYQQTTVNGAPWGQIDQGWVCLNYVSLQQPVNPVNPGTVIATGTVSSTTALNVRAGAGTGYARVTTLNPGTKISIYEKTTVNGMDWGRIGTNQWVCLAYVVLDGSTPVTPATTGTGTVISSTNLNIRSGAGSNYTRVGSLTPGTVVNIYEVVSNGTQQWGRIGNGQWVCMTYIRMSGSTPSTNVTYTGTVTSSAMLNVRAAAGTNNAIVSKLSPGTVITIYELVTVNGVNWGRIANGWVCMTYVQITGSSSGSGNVIWN